MAEDKIIDNDSDITWHEQLNDLIREKKTENVVLKKVMEMVIIPNEQPCPEKPDQKDETKSNIQL